MQILETVEAMRRARKGVGGVVGLVPTMGALHEGHLSLVRAAKQQCDHVAATIFVNPLQFGPNEDFSKYPRTFQADCAALQAEGVDWLFAPTADEMYPTGAETIVRVQHVSERLDGASRPGHFDGVATVVSKLFHIVRPDKAFFGQKDAAQLAVLHTMVRDLNFDLELVVCPIVRDRDGLALSSRNRYLSADEHERALTLSRALRAVEADVANGERRSSVLRQVLLRELRVEGIRLDYAEIVDAQSLLPVDDVSNGALVAIAAWIGTTRLIDNVLVAARQ